MGEEKPRFPSMESNYLILSPICFPNKALLKITMGHNIFFVVFKRMFVIRANQGQVLTPFHHKADNKNTQTSSQVNCIFHEEHNFFRMCILKFCN